MMIKLDDDYPFLKKLSVSITMQPLCRKPKPAK